MLHKLSIMLLSSAPKITQYTFKKMPIIPKIMPLILPYNFFSFTRLYSLRLKVCKTLGFTTRLKMVSEKHFSVTGFMETVPNHTLEVTG